MSLPNLYLTIPEANFDDLIPDILTEDPRYRKPVKDESGEVTGWERPTWREMSDLNRVAFGVPNVQAYQGGTVYIIKFEASRMRGHDKAVRDLRGLDENGNERPLTDPYFGVLSHSDVLYLIAQNQ